MNKHTRRDNAPLVAAFVVALLAAGSGWPPPAAGFQVNQPSTISDVPLTIRSNEAAFTRGFGLKFTVDPTTLADEALARHIDALSLSTQNGEPLVARDYRVAEQVIVAATEGTPTINAAVPTATGKNLFVTFHDAQGRVTQHAADQVGVFDLRGVPRCFDLKRVDEIETAIEVDLVLDRSGSMEAHLPAVKEAATRFMGLLPANARCRVTSFNATYTHHTPGYRACRPEQHDLDSIEAGGGTDIFGALAAVYEAIAQGGDSQRAVVVVTDGLGTSTYLTKETVQGKKSAATFVYWLGDYDETALQGLADEYIYGRDDVRRTLGRYFGSIGSAVRAQQVIVLPDSCSDSE